MKNSNLLLQAMLVSLMAFSCAQKEETPAEVATVPDPAPVSNPLLPGIPNGGSSTPQQTVGTVPFVPVSKAMMEAYVASHPLNNPTNYRVTVALKHVGDLRYGGEIRISYEDKDTYGQNRTYTGIFTAPEGKNAEFPSMGYNRDVGMYKAHFNYWYMHNNQPAFTGFFQDAYGAIVLVIDSALNLGDAQGGGTVSGSIWFRNFAYSFAPHSNERNCWFLYMGPYECRSDSIINKSSLEPTNGYRKLGTFQGLVKSQILN